MNINILIKTFQRQLAQTIQFSQLPVGVVYHVIKNQLKEIEDLYNKTVDAMINQQQQEEQIEDTSEQQQEELEVEEIQD